MILNDTLKLEKAMSTASSYAEWSEAAKQHDIETGIVDWKQSDFSKHFDYNSIRARLERLSRLWRNQDNAGLLYALNEGIHGNMDGIGNERLYHKAKFGTKKLIEEYVNAVANSLQYLASPKVADISFEEKLDFFRRAQHCYGRSAFLMSGSGMFLFFHLGVVKAMWKEGVLPNVLSGSSGGAVVGAMVCTHLDDEMDHFFDADYICKLIDDSGTVAPDPEDPERMSEDEVRDRITKVIPDMTFQEAYEKTGRHLNISIAPAEQHQTSRLLNAIASPNVYIREAVMASTAVPGIYPPVMLAAKDTNGERVPYLPHRRWVDGSITNDLPAKRLSRLYGCNHFIVSQANPLVTPFASDVKQQRGSLGAVRNATTATAKAWINAWATIWQKPLSYVPELDSYVNTALSVINQDYTGDINIVRPPLFWSWKKLVSKLPPEDIAYLLDLGERTAWPRLEMVRTQTKISKLLDSILADYESELVDDHDFAMKRKLA